MAYTVTNLPPLVASGTSAGAFTNAIGSLDDAESIMLFMTSSGNFASTGSAGLLLQVSQFDPAITAPVGVTQSTIWHTMSTTLFPIATSSGAAHVINAAGFRGIRLAGLTSAINGELVARVTKMIVAD